MDVKQDRGRPSKIYPEQDSIDHWEMSELDDDVAVDRLIEVRRSQYKREWLAYDTDEDAGIEEVLLPGGGKIKLTRSEYAGEAEYLSKIHI